MEDGLEEVLQIYEEIIARSVNFASATQGKSKFRLPILPFQTFNTILTKSKEIFSEEPIILQLQAPIYAIGDLHGHIFDLFRILYTIGTPYTIKTNSKSNKVERVPTDKKFLFLGDIVDRGEFSTETLSLILLLKVLYPENIFIIRGNHEFSEIPDHQDFYSELSSLYSNPSIVQTIFETFSEIPLAASIESNGAKFALCVHGGIGPSIYNDIQTNSLQRPIYSFVNNDLLTEILWSDPTSDSTVLHYAPSHRGLGKHFGLEAIKSFLQRTEYSILVRGHQCVMNGYECHLGFKVITVFSASNYCGDSGNKSAVMLIKEGETYSHQNFEPLRYIHRYEVALTPIAAMKPRKRAITNLHANGITASNSTSCMPNARLVLNNLKEKQSVLSPLPSSLPNRRQSISKAMSGGIPTLNPVYSRQPRRSFISSNTRLLPM